ncbi:MAG: phospho-N-acetylmuramoyl-pentapeptide-transferase [Eubacteriales bacterium]|nr:phospho-N-acetylmuramoyl-pentapeptide-transferase [Eubacteriales bacterium]
MNWTEYFPLLIAFVVTAVVTHYLIPFLKKIKMNQTEREEGVQSHLAKAGTPTMGGLAILAGIIAASVFYAAGNPRILPVLVLTLGFGLIGFCDDYLKVIKRNSDGLLAWQKLILELIVAVIFLLIMTRGVGLSMAMLLPFGMGKTISLGIMNVPFAIIVILAIVNGVNFTDGLDGLASTITIIVALFFTVASILGNGGITPITLAVIGALMGFLVFNAYPAQIFMGDTGSLALGGFVAGAAYMMQMPLYIPIVGFIYAFELLSVAMQVTYFKMTHGKRIFKMTPIHHHFELCGWSETQIVVRFAVLTILLCVVALM